MGVETYEALLAIAQSGAQVPPAVLIELHPNLDPNTKQKILQQLQQPDPIQQLEQAKAQAEIEKMKADTQLSQAKAMDTMRGEQSGNTEHPMVTMAEVENKQADTAYKKAQTLATMQDAMLKPREQQHQEQMDREQAVQGRAKMAIDKQGKDADRMQNAYEKSADRQDADKDRQQAAYESEADREQTKNDPKLDLEREKLNIERERLQAEREDKEKERSFQKEEKERDREFNAEKEGFARKGTREKELSSVLSGFAKAFKQIDAKLDRLDNKIDDVAEDQKAPVTIERGKDGRVAGVTKGKRKMTVQRGKDGRVTGVQ
jgi:delta 1-pyrroline-5-carboxylate dehydrogenase